MNFRYISFGRCKKNILQGRSCIVPNLELASIQFLMVAKLVRITVQLVYMKSEKYKLLEYTSTFEKCNTTQIIIQCIFFRLQFNIQLTPQTVVGHM